MSSNSSDKEQQELPLPVADEAATNLRKHQSCHARKLKTVLGILLIVGVVAAVGVCAAVFAPSKKNGKKSASEEFADLQTREHLYKTVCIDAGCVFLNVHDLVQSANFVQSHQKQQCNLIISIMQSAYFCECCFHSL